MHPDVVSIKRWLGNISRFRKTVNWFIIKELAPGRIRIDNDAVDKLVHLLDKVFQNPFKEVTGLTTD